MVIYFLRHASAGKHKSAPAQDERRPLDRDGMAQCRQIGQLLAAANVEVEQIVSSPLKRASQTAALVGNEIGYQDKIEFDPALHPNGPFDGFLRLLAKHSRRESLMVVGHNPSMSAFLSLMVSEGATDASVDLKKGAVAKVQMTGSRAGTLLWCLTPRLAYAAETLSSRPKTSRK